MRTGIVGCGRIAAFHLPPVLRRLGPAAIAVADIDRKSAQSMAEQYRLGAAYSDLDAMLVEHRPNVVHILTPPATHVSLAIQALEAGCHVLVEKPMAMRHQDALSMVDAARENDVKLCVDHNFLFHPMIRKALSLVEQGKAGRVLNADVRYSFDVRRGQPATTDGRIAGETWLSQLRGGLLFDSFPHPASILLRITGEPVRVSSAMSSNGILPNGEPDELAVLVKGAEAMGTLSISLGTRPDCFTATIYATGMTIQVNCSNMTMLLRKHRNIPKGAYRATDNLHQATRLIANTVSGSLGVALGLVKPPGDIAPVIDGFYDSVEKGIRPPVTGHEAAHVVRMADAIWSHGPGEQYDQRPAEEAALARSRG